MAPGPSQDTPVGMMPGAPPMGLQKPATLPIRQPVGQQNLPIGFGMSKEAPKGTECVYTCALLFVPISEIRGSLWNIHTYPIIMLLCFNKMSIIKLIPYPLVLKIIKKSYVV